MARLLPFPFNSPGVAGLNKTGQTDILGSEWATRATDLVIDENGRLANRKGTRIDSSNTAGTNWETRFVGINSSGTKTKYAADAGGTIYELTANAWVTRDGYTNPANGNFKFQTFNNKVIAWHADGQELVQSAPGANFVQITASSGSVPNGVDVLAAYGRVWVLGQDDLYYSDLLDETDWATGTAGSTPLKHVWPGGTDIAVGLAEFNGHLVIFGQQSIVIYSGPEDPATAFSTFTLVEQIKGTGCINRDSIQNVGNDVFFLSANGMRSLERTIQEKSMPLTDICPHMRDYILAEYSSSTAHKVTSTYSETYGLYLLSLQQTTIVIDTRGKLPNGGFRATEWKAMAAVADDGSGGILMGDGTNVSLAYQGILDDVAYDGTGGTGVEGDYESGWLDFESVAQGASMLFKFIKQLKLSVAGGASSTVTFKWYVDYKDSPTTIAASIAAAPDAAQYGIAQYSIDQYGTDVAVTDLSRPGSRGGRVVKVGFKVTDSVSAFAINSLAVFAKTGKQAV